MFLRYYFAVVYGNTTSLISSGGFSSKDGQTIATCKDNKGDVVSFSY